MRYYKIYGNKYAVEDTASEVPDAYAVKGQIVDEQPRGKKIGYVTMRDGSLIECYKTPNYILIFSILFAIIAIVGAALFFIMHQSKDVVNPIDNTPIKIGNDTDVVTYNGFMSLESGSLSVDFTNGEQPCTIQVVGDGIKSEPITVNSYEYVASVPATFETDKGLVQATIIIKTETSESSQDIVIEIPDNNTDNSPDAGLEGYWKGEFIYGTGVN